ncbi:MAG: hypothetical protein AAFP78_01335 [Pseudomonadota bacterium]
MSFFRPEARALIARWAETGAYVVAGGGLLWWLLARGPADPVWRWGLIAFVAVTGALFIRSAVLSALSKGEGEAPGVVQIDERRIAYFGPHQGGLVSINDIQAIEIWTADESVWRYEPDWVLRWSETESALIIPVSAQGADGLPDAFTALPGFNAAKAIAALKAPEGRTVTIWRRAAAMDAPALAPPAARA